MKRKLQIVLIFTLSLVWLMVLQAVCLGATYYLDAVNGNDSNPGTSEQPWKTVEKSKAVAVSGDTIKLRDGNYGAYEETGITRTDWVTYKNDTGATPIFTKISILNSSPANNVYLKFDGIKIEYPAPNPMPPDDGWWHHEFRTNVYIKYSRYVDIRNCVLVGFNKYLVLQLLDVRNSQYVNIYHNDLSVAQAGMDFVGCADCNFTYNYVHDLSFGSVLGADTCTGNNLFEGNHIYKVTRDANDPYYPYNEPDPHPGSGFAVRSNYLTIRNNIFHYLQLPQGLMFYGARGAYHDIIFENNLFYDTSEVKFYNCGNDVLIRNNTFYGGRRNEGLTKQDICYKYSGQVSLGLYSGYDGNNVEIYNNLFVNMWSLPDPLDETLYYLENYNIFWERGGTNAYSTTKGENSKLIWWMTTNPTVWHGWPNYFNDIGFTGSTPEYNYSIEGIKPFFVNPGFLLNGDASQYYEGGYGAESGLFWDYHLAPGSPGINFGDPNNQPTDSLGSLDENNKFILPNGPARDVTHHSVGCYEYVTVQEPEQREPEQREPDRTSMKCYNNVFNPIKGERALIIVNLPKQARVKLVLYNTRGNRIRELADEEEDAGPHKYHWDGKDDSGSVVGSGLYFVHIEAGDYKKTKKIVVVK